MENDLKVTLLQSPLDWENPSSNLARFDKKLEALPQGTIDLIILPEMFTTGFSMNAQKLAETMDGPTRHWMQKVASRQAAAVCGSIIIREGDACYNRLIWAESDGTLHTYDKRHCFTLAGEDQYFQAGKERLIVNFRGWKICPLICYDLRFPVWSRNTVEYDLLIYVANWPNRRSQAWKNLLVGRAIENLSYTIGVNRVGRDENDIYYSGDSSVIDFAGEVLYQVAKVEDMFTISLSKKAQDEFRNKLQFLPDRDDFEIKI